MPKCNCMKYICLLKDGKDDELRAAAKPQVARLMETLKD